MRFTISLKLAAAFVAVLALTAVIGVSAIVRTGSMSDSTAVVGERVVPATRLIGDLKDTTGKYRRNQILFVVRQSDKEEIDGNAADIAAAIDEYAKRYSTSAGDTKALEGFRDAWTNYVETTMGVFTLPANDVNGVTKIISDGAGDAAWEEVKTSLKAWDEANARTAASLVAETRASASSTKTTSIVLLIGGMLVALAIAVLLTRSLSRGLSKLVKAARGIAQGDVEQDVALTSNDEIGDAGRAFDEMVEYLRGSVVAADRIAQGDLSADIEPRSERDALGHALQNMTVGLRSAIGDVAGSATTVAAASQQMAGSAQETGRAVGEIALAIGEIAEGAEAQVRSVSRCAGRCGRSELRRRRVGPHGRRDACGGRRGPLPRSRPACTPPTRPTTRCAPCARRRPRS